MHLNNLERAAPALLEALKAMMKQFENTFWMSMSVADRDAVVKARAAIAAATAPEIDPVTKLPWNRDGEDE